MSKIGRPRLMNSAEMEEIKINFPGARTKRSIQNYKYLLIALSIFNNNQELKFLVNAAREEMKHSILIELGRIRDKDYMLLVARYICSRARAENKTVHEWAQLVRKIRKDSRLIRI